MDLIEEKQDERLIISFPRTSCRQLLYNLIENKKGYEYGYQQGRADLLMPYDVESIEELIENVKSKAREDAIDEAMKILHELRNDDTNEVGMISVEKAEVYSKIRSILEQLKEKSNE